MAANDTRIYGLLAEFPDPGALLKAAAAVRQSGYRRFDCHSPFPVHGMDAAMGLGRSPLGYMVGIAGGLGLIGITLFIWWVSAVDYPLVISGKELFSFQAFVPPMFAITILAAAITATIGMIGLNKLPRLHHPLFDVKRFAAVTDNGFFVSIEAADPNFRLEETRALLLAAGASHVEVVDG